MNGNSALGYGEPGDYSIGDEGLTVSFWFAAQTKDSVERVVIGNLPADDVAGVGWQVAVSSKSAAIDFADGAQRVNAQSLLESKSRGRINWHHVTAVIDSAADDLAPKVNPAEVALVVNGTPVPRVAEKMNGLDVLPRFGVDFEEDWITRVLFAQQVWQMGRGLTPEQIDGVKKMVLQHIGGGDEAGGLGKLKAEGIEEEQFEWMVKATATAIGYTQELGKSGKIEKLE